MTFADLTPTINRFLGPDAFALFLKSPHADITVQGEGDRWELIVFQLDGEGRSHIVLKKRLGERDEAVRMAWGLAGVLSKDRVSIWRIAEFAV